MTLGQKLSAYRKLSGITQQQLGEQLNVSAQAVSKWENDQTEPDLNTMRALADIYKVTVDTLLSTENVPFVLNEEPDTLETEAENAPALIGFCKTCGISVTEENLGEQAPVVLCKKCLQDKKLAAERAAVAEKRAKEAQEAAKKREIYINREACKRRFIWSTAVASIVAAIIFFSSLSSLIADFTFSYLIASVVITYIVFAFVSCLFYDCFVQEVVVDWFGKSFHAPGLIFSFDLDGLLWLIFMKLFFFVLGILLGIAAAIIGIALGLICAPFVFPFVMRRLRNDYKSGVRSDLL